MAGYKKRIRKPPSPLSETSRDKLIHATLRSEIGVLTKKIKTLEKINIEKNNIILLLISIYGITVLTLWNRQ
jgi:hypothetical protein